MTQGENMPDVYKTLNLTPYGKHNNRVILFID